MSLKKKFHVDNQFISNPYLFGPFYLFQICDLACSDDYEVAEHDQIGYEITYIVSGEGVFSRNGVEYPVSRDMLFLVSKDDLHYIKSSRNNPLRYVCMCFNFNLNDKRSDAYVDIIKFLNSFTNPIAMDMYNIYEVFARVLNELSNYVSTSQELIASYISEIIIYTYRSFTKQQNIKYFSTLKIESDKKFVYEIINILDSDKISIKNLQDLGTKLGYNYSYMSAIFSKVMGQSIKAYYTKRRFERAAEMLTEGFEINEISDTLGFQSVHSFNRAFRNYFGSPPGEYRSKIKNN